MFHLTRHMDVLTDVRTFLENDGDWDERYALIERMHDVITDFEDYIQTREAQRGDSFGS